MARDTYTDVDEADSESKPDVLGTAIVVLTTLVLLVATYVMQTALKDHYNAGMFADKTKTAPPQ